ncbi:hypothetical protein L228DRAFT_271022 [Xylona heveae TC161]|uniref:Uncharacterized protein n=1 Tax=Xylona heveae (strain CBS 132557 / TC161) TaxID=1328760 RepID=A0A164ZYH5_XYLHT|nr:hypothetical protein L228DRAFT_271022 [Xylona heveae TC161]KZF19702.1 hypothetical protein L228DRAFT_271022 [Xylona heveae TC161]
MSPSKNGYSNKSSLGGADLRRSKSSKHNFNNAVPTDNSTAVGLSRPRKPLNYKKFGRRKARSPSDSASGTETPSLGSDDDGDDEDEDEDESDDQDDEPDDFAPFDGRKAGKKTAGKSAAGSHGTGHDNARPTLAGKKRTFSNLGSELSDLDDEAVSDNETPLAHRRKVSRTKSDSSESLSSVVDSESAISHDGAEGGVSTHGATSDDDYAGVDLISDSDAEDHGHLEELEEAAIIQSEENDTPTVSAAPSISGGDSDWGDFDLDGNFLFPDVPFIAEFSNAPDTAAGGVQLVDPSNPLDMSSVDDIEARHVRFQSDNHDSDSSSSSDEDNFDFPDLFLQQDSLEPGFRLMIENDQDADDGYSTDSDGEGSYWDFRGSDDLEDVGQNEKNEESESSSDSEASYESEEGDTTDDDLPPPALLVRRRSVLRRSPSPSSGSDSSSTVSFRRPINPPARRTGPSMGSWVADPNKPIAVIDSSGKRMVIYPAQNPLQRDSKLFGFLAGGDTSASSSPRTSFQSLGDESENDRSDYSSHGFSTPMIGNGANLMMPGLLHGAPGSEHLLSGQVLGPPEAFYPFKAVGPDGDVMEDDDDEEEDEDLWNVHDFIDFGDGSSDSEDAGQETDVPASPANSTAANPSTTPHKAETIRSGDVTARSMLEHFDRGVVTAFRSNQTRHKILLGRAQSREYSPMGPFQQGGGVIKGGRHAAVNSPITPLRKRRTARGPSVGDNSPASRGAQNRQRYRQGSQRSSHGSF